MMHEEEEFDWFSSIVSFLFAAVPTWIFVGAVVWKFNPYTDGSIVLLIATTISLIVGVLAGILGSGFWDSAKKVASFSPYARKKK